MRTLVVSCVAAVVAAGAPAGQAQPATGGPRGRNCASTVVAWADDGATAVVSGGPLAGHGTLICTVVRNADRHDNPAVLWRVEQPSADGVALLAPQVAEWQLGEDDWGYLCTSWRHPDGTMLYWHGGWRAHWPWDDEPGYWTADPTGAWCNTRGQGSTGSLLDEVDEVDERACPVLVAEHSGPYDPSHPYRVYVDDDGDVYLDDDGDGRVEGDELWWDCPPYGWDDPAADPLQ